jgi:hypothetical protein
MKALRMLLFALITLAGLAWFVWPTSWTYATELHGTKRGGTKEVSIRFHRLSGEKQTFIGEEWVDGSIEF